MQKKNVKIYCDGSCLKNPGPGGWAAILLYNQRDKLHEKIISGYKRNTTNNRMELTAATKALLALKSPCNVKIFSDSTYVVKGMMEWISAWKKRNWKNASGKLIENLDLWQKLEIASDFHTTKWHWVKAHSGHVFNELVDQEARKQALKAQKIS